MSLIPLTVTSLHDREMFRVIRNEGVETLSRNARAVTPIENEAFWAERGNDIRAWLYLSDADVVGIGSLQRRDGRLWEYVGVKSFYEGHGYGGEILEHLVSQANGEPVWCTIRTDNVGALRMNERMGGWESLGESDGIVVQVYRPGAER